MIVKERTIPVRIQKNNALLKRLPQNHFKRAEIEEDQARRWAGFKGEESLDYHLNKLPEKDFLIFHGIRLSNGNYHFQIDTLILSPYFALILEVKNFSGILTFDESSNQFIQITLNGEKGFQNPIEQASVQAHELKKWLEKHDLNIPIDFLVVISKPSTILKTAPNNSRIFQKVIHAQYLVSRIEKIKMSYKENLTNTKELKRITRIILKEHTPEKIDILGSYKIPKSEIITGVICPGCISYSMKRQFGTWYCPMCRIKDKHAHRQALMEYFLLNNDIPISNGQVRKFLHLSSPYTANRLLSALKLPCSGSNRGRVYYPHPNYQCIKGLD